MSTDSADVAWITGGGRGIGRTLAPVLGRRGRRVWVSGRRLGFLEALAALAPGQLVALPLDVTRPEQVRERRSFRDCVAQVFLVCK